MKTSTDSSAQGPHDLSGRTCVITGATGGIGRETALALAHRGAELVLLARNPKKAEETVRELKAVSPHGRVEVIEADLSDLRSVQRAAAVVKERHPRVHVLLNNAGGVFMNRELSKDGFEMTFAVNHLAHFVLTRALLDNLRAAAPARVVHVASAAHLGAKLNPDDLMSERSYQGFRTYCNSKLCNILFSNVLARRLEKSGVTSNALHPGTVATGFGKNTPGFFNALVSIGAPFLLSAKRGAKTSVHVASAPELETVSGRYFVRCKPRTPSRTARDEALAERLWQESERLTASFA